MISSTRRIFFYGSSPPSPSSDRLSGIFLQHATATHAPLCLPFLTKRLEKKLMSYLKESKSRIFFTKCLRAVIRCHWAGTTPALLPHASNMHPHTDSLPVFAYPGHFSSLPVSRRNHDAVFFRTGLWPNSEARIIIIL